MALGAITLKKVFSIGDRKEVIADVVIGSGYPTGGVALSGSALGLELELNNVASSVARKTSDGSDAITTSYDDTNGKLQCYQSTTGAPAKLVEVANATDLSGYTVRLRAIGKGSAAA